MRTRYKLIDKDAVYLTTSTVVGLCNARLNGRPCRNGRGTGRYLQELFIKNIVS
jgi:hypothetical protein